MLNQWIDRLAAALDTAPSADANRADLERVSALLLVEIAWADHQIDELERKTIRAALRQASSIADEELDSILDAALADAQHTVSLHEHIRQINGSFDKTRKLMLVEQMWRVALADGDLDKYEEYTIRKLCDLLHVKHRDFIQAKLRVLESVGDS